MATALSSSDLTEEQLWGIDKFVKWYKHGRQFGFDKLTFKMAGPAGSGKSALMLFALEAVGLDPNGSEVASVGFTGKCVMVMRNKGLIYSKTIHSSIYIPVDGVDEQIKEMRSALLKMRGTLSAIPLEQRDQVNLQIEMLVESIRTLQEQANDDAQFILNPNGAIASMKLVVCDEAGMVGGNLAKDLESYGVPVLYLGDQFQLGPVTDGDEGDSVFFDGQNNPLPVDHQLTEIHRQAEGSPIIRYSRALRENRTDELSFMGKMVGDGGSTLIRVPRSQLKIEHMARAEQIVVGKNATRHIVNANVRDFLGRDDPYPVPGDKVVFLKNNKEYDVVNGMLGVVAGNYYDYNERAQSFKIEVDLEDGRRIIAPVLVPYFQDPGNQDALYEAPGWARKKCLHMDYANALTCHKVQGSQYYSGIVLSEPLGKTAEMRRRWEYTALTRFEQNAIQAV